MQLNPVLMVTRNNLALTKKAVASVLTQDAGVDLLVMDNASVDNTVPWLRTKPVVLSVMPIQDSLAHCWNWGLKHLWMAGATECLVVNNDVVLRPDTYAMLTMGIKLGRDFVSCVSVNDPTQLGTPGDRGLAYLGDSWRPHPDFSCFMITQRCWQKVGPFDETYYPAYCEDNDYHVRMHRMGVQAGCVDLPFLHLGAQTIKNAEYGESERIHRMAQNNRLRFYKKYGCMPGSPEYSLLFT